VVNPRVELAPSLRASRPDSISIRGLMPAGPGRTYVADMLKRMIGFWAAIFVLFFVVTQPATAADFVHVWYHGVHDIGTALARFVSDL
jgi:hypothetical protein